MRERERGGESEGTVYMYACVFISIASVSVFPFCLEECVYGKREKQPLKLNHPPLCLF